MVPAVFPLREAMSPQTPAPFRTVRLVGASVLVPEALLLKVQAVRPVTGGSSGRVPAHPRSQVPRGRTQGLEEADPDRTGENLQGRKGTAGTGGPRAGPGSKRQPG